MKKICNFSLIVLFALFLVACGGSPKKPTKTEEPKVDASAIPPEKAYAYGLQALRKKQYDQAGPLFDIAVKQPDARSEVFANAGIAFIRNNELDKGVEYLEKALKIFPLNATNKSQLINELAIAYRETGEFKKAAEQYAAMLKLDQTNGTAHYNLGVLCDLYMQKLRCASRHYRQYLAFANQQAEADTIKQVNIWVRDVEGRLAALQPAPKVAPQPQAQPSVQ